MAFKIENRASIRLNHIPAGQQVDLCDFQSKKVIHTNAWFSHWEIDGQEVAAPKVIKSAPQNIVQVFTVEATETTPAHDIKLVKDPAGFGAMFIKNTVGEGDEAKTTLRRVTAYASEEVINKSKLERHPPKAEPKEEAPAEEAQPEA